MVRLKYLTKLLVEPILGTNKRRLLDQFVVLYNSEYIVVPKNTLTDYASIPNIIPRWIIDEDDKYIREAAVLHDYVYSKASLNSYTRKECDLILYHGMLALNSPKWKARLVYLAVRCFGWMFYKKD